MASAVYALSFFGATADAATVIWRSGVSFQADFVQGMDAVSVCRRIPEFWNQSPDDFNYSPTVSGAPSGSGLGNNCNISYKSTGQWAFTNNDYLYSVALSASLFVDAAPEESAEPCACDASQNSVGEPIDPANGAVVKNDGDLRGRTSFNLEFGRSYASANLATSPMGTAWKNTYSRSIKADYQSYALQSYSASSTSSSLYNDESAACTSGFAEIRSHVASWTGAQASLQNHTCVISKDGLYLSRLLLNYGGSGSLAPNPNIIGYTITRDDGQVIRFSAATNAAGEYLSPANVGLRLRATSGGFSVTDSNDNVELYDSNGRLLSITNRVGLVQTMSYDSSNRLSAVTDSFGHRLIFSYDALSRISTVSRQ